MSGVSKFETSSYLEARVFVSIWIHDRQNVEIHIIKNLLDRRTRLVAVHKLQILNFCFTLRSLDTILEALTQSLYSSKQGIPMGN